MAPEMPAGRGADVPQRPVWFAVTMIYAMLRRFPYAGDPASGDDDRTVLVQPTVDERKDWGALGSAMLDVLFCVADADPGPPAVSVGELEDEFRLIDEIPEGEGRAIINPSWTASRALPGQQLGNTGNRGLDDAFARATYVPTLLDTELLPTILRTDMRLVLLTGNPGDGKTSFLVQVGERLRAQGAELLADDEAGWRLSLNGHMFVAVYDASESHGDKSSDDLMRDALDPGPGEDPQRRTVLLAINDGRLLHFFTEYEDLYEDEAAEVYRQMDGKPVADPTIALVDLKRRTLAPWPGGAQPGGPILDSFTDPALWSPCAGCLSRDICPMLRNAAALRGLAREAVDELIATSYLRRQRRATFRDVRSALAWLITGDHACQEVHRHANVTWTCAGRTDALVEDLAFDSRSPDYLIREWS